MWLQIPKLAWRNLGRNRRRTLVTGAALAFGICLCVASYGLVDGLSAQLIRSLTRLDIGHVQLHDKKFIERRALSANMAEPDKLLQAADTTKGVVGAAPRVYVFALVSGKGKSSGVELVGVEPAREKKVTELAQYLTEGSSYLPDAPTPWPKGRKLSAKELATDQALTDLAEEDALAEIDAIPTIDGQSDDAAAGGDTDASDDDKSSTGDKGSDDDSSDDDDTLDDGDSPDNTGKGDEPAKNTPPLNKEAAAKRSKALAEALSPRPSAPLPVMLGTSLAKVLGVKSGDALYASTVTVDGNAEAAHLRVAGLYETGTQQYDRHRLYLHIADLRRLTHLGGGAHEVTLAVEPIAQASTIATQLSAAVPADVAVRPWNGVRPDMEQMLQLNEVSTDLMVFIIFIVATLGVVNTMLMSVFERTRELGVLKAIGMSGKRIVGLIVCETLLLVLVASFVGTLLGLGLDAYMVLYGVDLSATTGGVSLAGIGIRPVIYGVITPRGVVMPTAVLAISCVLASLYPAIRAARLRPAIGMRET